LWIRRASITAQLGAKSATDTALLAAVIEANLADPEFFIRKAIGWALRDYAKADPDWVSAFVRRHGERLSPLSRREAVRNLPA
jgi:3-methyladenine DNA glycosylase AlkD